MNAAAEPLPPPEVVKQAKDLSATHSTRALSYVGFYLSLKGFLEKSMQFLIAANFLLICAIISVIWDLTNHAREVHDYEGGRLLSFDGEYRYVVCYVASWVALLALLFDGFVFYYFQTRGNIPSKDLYLVRMFPDPYSAFDFIYTASFIQCGAFGSVCLLLVFDYYFTLPQNIALASFVCLTLLAFAYCFIASSIRADVSRFECAAGMEKYQRQSLLVGRGIGDRLPGNARHPDEEDEREEDEDEGEEGPSSKLRSRHHREFEGSSVMAALRQESQHTASHSSSSSSAHSFYPHSSTTSSFSSSSSSYSDSSSISLMHQGETLGFRPTSPKEH